MPGTEPIRPTGTPTKITIGQGESLSVLAAKYNTTIDMIKKANNLTSDNVREGQVLTVNVVTDKELKEYEKLRAQYDAKVKEEKEKAEIEQRTEKAQQLIEKAKKDGYGKEYDFSINDNGHIIITLKTEKQLGEIREDFGLKEGALRKTNPSIEQKYKIAEARDHNGEKFETWDNVKASVGHTFVIDTNEFSTERTWAQAWQDEVVTPVKNWWHKHKPW